VAAPLALEGRYLNLAHRAMIYPLWYITSGGPRESKICAGGFQCPLRSGQAV